MRPYYLFELDNPNATDADYEAGTGDGSYVVYNARGAVIKKVARLEEAEALIQSLAG